MAADVDTATGELSTTTLPDRMKDQQAPTDSIELAAEDYDDVVDGSEDNRKSLASVGSSKPSLRLAVMVGFVMIVALTALSGWLGFRMYQSHQAQEQRQLFVEVGRQGALNLTTIDWQHADADVQRVLDSATGSFYEEFSKNQQPFVEVVKKAQSKSVGTITEAGLESEAGDQGQVLVAVSVKTSTPAAAEPAPRAWRMRISVTKVDGEAKVSKVEFVP